MSTSPKYTWHKLADSLEELSLPANGSVEIEVNHKTICISLHKDQVFACSAKCPHAGGRLADGYLDTLGNIVCPIHRYKFNLKSGRNSSGEGYYLKTFPIEIRLEGIFVGFEERNLFNWLK